MNYRNFNNSFTINIFLILLSIALTGCAADRELISNWSTTQINIDGDDSDWGPASTWSSQSRNEIQFLPEENVTLSFRNNSKYLYICIKTNDFSKVMPMFRNGFIVWFEPENGNAEIFGIKYPLHNIFDENNQAPIFSREMFDKEKQGEIIRKIIENQNELQILNEDKFPLTLYKINNKNEINVKLGYHSDRFVYELAVPLANNDFPYNLSVMPEDKLKIKFETEEADIRGSGGRRGGMKPSGGIGPGGGRKPPGGIQHKSENRSFETINFSVELTFKKII